jgi:phospholipid/cholesterol/gamma-HCH transport system substrate-binding protein
MAKQFLNNVKLGLFVLAGLIFLILLMYMIGKNKNMFGSNYMLKARFQNVQGLVAGNNVRFSGIQAGTVKKIAILNDTVIEVTMLMEKRMQTIIRQNAIASIGSEGLVGNKVVNIVPGKYPAALAAEGDILPTKKTVDTDEIIQTLNKTSDDIAIITSEIKTILQHINSSTGILTLLDDKSIPGNIKASLANILTATDKASRFTANLNNILADIKNGKGSLGALISDTAISMNLNAAILKLKAVGNETDTLAQEINRMVTGIQQDINSGKGTVNALLKDSLMVIKLNSSLDNIQKGTDGFNQNMEALKHNFLLRGYFRKLEKKKNN